MEEELSSPAAAAAADVNGQKEDDGADKVEVDRARTLLFSGLPGSLAEESDASLKVVLCLCVTRCRALIGRLKTFVQSTFRVTTPHVTPCQLAPC